MRTTTSEPSEGAFDQSNLTVGFGSWIGLLTSAMVPPGQSHGQAMQPVPS